MVMAVGVTAIIKIVKIGNFPKTPGIWEIPQILWFIIQL